MKKSNSYSQEENSIPSTVDDIDFSATYSYADYMRFKFEDRLEIIRGKIFLMGAPFRIHQKIFGIIFNQLYNFLEGHQCEVYGAPFDVRLQKNRKKDKDIFTVVQPDIVVVCDPQKLDKRGCIGAPDLIIEILSPGNTKKERVYKYDVYEENGVKEYWIADPAKKIVQKYLLDQRGQFQDHSPNTLEREINSSIIPGFNLNLTHVFDVK